MQILLSKHMGQKFPNEPITKTVEEEYVQGYNYAISKIVSESTFILKDFKKETNKSCGILRGWIRHVKLVVLKCDMYTKIASGCPACSRLMERKESPNMGSIRSQALFRSDSLKKHLINELPIFLNACERGLHMVCSMMASIQMEISLHFVVELEGFLVSWENGEADVFRNLMENIDRKK